MVPNAQTAHRWSLFGNEAIMNVSSIDLNNVQEDGDYSFRDGTITVTFAEVAIWKNNPNAKFQLMRKRLIQARLDTCSESGLKKVLEQFFINLPE